MGKRANMATEKKDQLNETKEWENPMAPEQAADARDKEQAERQYKEAKLRKENLTETDHLDNENKK